MGDSFACYDSSKYPLIDITLKGKIKDVDDVNTFINKWELCYDINNPKMFIFVINTLQYIPSLYDLKYSMKLLRFIRKIKDKMVFERKYSKLDKSIIIVNSHITRHLLKMIFSLQTPLSTIYIVESVEDANILYYNFIHDIECNLMNVSVIHSKLKPVTYQSKSGRRI